MPSPSMSVIVPVRNSERYISESVNSVLSQTFADFELLVIDDGSSDATEAILAEFQKADPRLKVFKNPGAGLVDALNHGIARASSELIARMDADDVCLPDRLQRQYDYLGVHPEIAAVGTQVRFIDEHGALTDEKIRLPESPQTIAEMLLKGCCLRHPTVVIRREALERLGGYRQELAYAEDYDLWLRMSEHYALANLPETLLLYRVHAAQISEQKEWSQRLARNLALLAANERRAGRLDPIGSYNCFDKDAQGQRCKRQGCADCVCETVTAFRVAGELVSGRKAETTKEHIALTLRYVSQNTMGDGKKSQMRVLMALLRDGAIRGSLPQLTSALGVAIRLHPGRTLRALLGLSRYRELADR